MTTITAATGLTLAGIYATDEVVAATLPVDLATDTWRTMIRQIVPVEPGDVLDIQAWARVTNDTGKSRNEPGYTVGVGWHVWAYDCDSGQGTAGPWWRISPYCGDNVDRTRHHMPLHISTVYTVPDDWPDGHRIVIVLRADAHSTAWVAGDTLTVDKDYGHLKVRRYARQEA